MERAPSARIMGDLTDDERRFLARQVAKYLHLRREFYQFATQTDGNEQPLMDLKRKFG